jgi:hypothetical protein
MTAPASADEGMWTFNDFPSARVGQAYGFTPDAAWLDHLRLSSLKFGNGCSGSIVSGSGLVMTNHHCARTCIENLSGLRRQDYQRDGFLAHVPAAEARCPGLEVSQLVQITNVTAQVRAATDGVPAERFNDAQKAAIAAIEKACATAEDVRCDVVALWHGGRYDLYRYHRHTDVRLVFAPEESAAFFGGDPDNFNFPRYDLDVSFLRIYGPDGRPAATPDHLAWGDGHLRDGDLTFVSGHPGGTSRAFTLAQFDDERDDRLPLVLYRLAELRGVLEMYQTRGPEQARQSQDLLFGTENAFKALKGRQEALADPSFHAGLARREAEFRTRLAADPRWSARAGGAWDEIARIVRREAELRPAYEVLERPPESRLFRIARGLLRYAEETAKPNGERLKEFADARLPLQRHDILADRPVYPEMEIATLAWSLTKVREQLGADHPFVKRLFGSRSPLDVATQAVKGSRLADLSVDADGHPAGGYRKTLFDGGKPALEASHDPMLELARAFEPEARAIRRRMETEVEGPTRMQQELIAQARFALEGTKEYPDATGTLRLSYGSVRGWQEGARTVVPFTRFAGAYARATGTDPFRLPATWLKARPRLDLDTPLDFVTTNDIIGGNSGSPVVDREGCIVGLVFDGNIHSLGGDYGYDPVENRTVAVHASALLEALGGIYDAQRLVAELKSTQALASGAATTAIAHSP